MHDRLGNCDTCFICFHCVCFSAGYCSAFPTSTSTEILSEPGLFDENLSFFSLTPSSGFAIRLPEEHVRGY